MTQKQKTKQSISGCPAIAAVIEKLGGASKVAEIVGLQQSSIYWWVSKGAVPPRRTKLLKEYADKNDIPLKYSEFFHLPIKAEDVKKLVRTFYNKLENDTVFELIKADETYCIRMPWLDSYGDYLDIYVERTDDGYLLSDGGETCENFSQISQIPQKHLDHILSNASVDIKYMGGKCILSIKTTDENFGRDMNSLMQYIFEISHFNI